MILLVVTFIILVRRHDNTEQFDGSGDEFFQNPIDLKEEDN